MDQESGNANRILKSQHRFRMDRKSGQYGFEYPRPFLSKQMDQEPEISNGIPETIFVETDGQESGHGRKGIPKAIFVDGTGHGTESEYGRMPKTVFVDTDGPGVRTWSKRNTQCHFFRWTMTLTSDRIWLNTQDHFLNNTQANLIIALVDS